MNVLSQKGRQFLRPQARALRLTVRHHGDLIVWETQSVAEGPYARAFRAVLEGDAEELFRKPIERQGDSRASGLGLLILRKDHAPRDGFVRSRVRRHGGTVEA